MAYELANSVSPVNLTSNKNVFDREKLFHFKVN